MAKQSGSTGRTWKYKIILACVWAAILIFCLLNRESFTVDGVLAYTPKNDLLAAAFMMFLFALKSMSVFIFCGILFAVNGILFPLPAAIGLNILGAGIMVSLPYWLGKRLGKDAIDRIVQKYPKVERLRSMHTDHEFTISFFMRMINLLPSDILSLYMGAVGVRYRKYLPGSLLGMLPPIITFPIMGMNISTPGSPAFLVSACVQAAITVISIGGYWLYHKKQAGN